MNLQHLSSEAFRARAMDHFRCLYAESAERAKIMAISCHPYLSGVPHRIAHVERTFADILGHEGVVAWDGPSCWTRTRRRPRRAMPPPSACSWIVRRAGG